MDSTYTFSSPLLKKKSFSRAAEMLHMTQPAVSQHIKTFERNMNAKLLERNNKMVRMTKAGEVVYSLGKEILARYSRMRHLVDDMLHKASGKLTIGDCFTFQLGFAQRTGFGNGQNFKDERCSF